MARSFTDNGSTTTSYVGKSVGVATGLPISISCWINATTFTGFPIVIQIDDGTNTNYVALDMTGTGQVFATTKSSGGSVWAQTTVTASTNTWTHVAGVFASATSRAAYINGGNKITDATSNTPATLNRTSIGSDRVNGDGLNGSLAWVGIWKIALSDQDVANLGQAIHPFNVRPDQLVACVDLIGASPEPDRVSPTTWTVGGAGASAVANSPRIYFPRNSAKYKTAAATPVLFGGSTVAKVSSANAPVTIGKTFGGNAQPAASIGFGSFTIGRPFIPNQTLRLQAFGALTIIRITPVIPPSTGYYVFLENDGAYLSDLLTGGIDYSARIQLLISGPYPDSGTAFQALWTFLNLPFPFANPLPPPPPGPWTNR